jgi:ferrous-iron efflux pump FieF
LLLAIGERLVNPHQVQREEVGIAISALAVVLTLALVTFQRHVVRRSGSIAIDADMAHYRTDLVASVVTGFGTFLSGRLDEPLIDSGVAALVALYLMRGAWQTGRSSFDMLMDRELPESDRRRIEGIALANAAVAGVHEMRTRSAGLTRFIQLHLDVDRDLSLIRAHEISDEVEAEIRKAYPDAEIILHVDPSPAP